MVIQKVFIDGKFFEIGGVGYEPKGDVMWNGGIVDSVNHPELIFAGKIATLCANARVMYSETEKAKRIEFRTPDPMANPYLSFSAMLLAGIDGIINKIDPGKPFDGNAYEHKGELKLPSVPSSLYESLDALEADHEFLTATGVFPKELITAWIGMKRKEADEVRLSIPPKEFELYVSG